MSLRNRKYDFSGLNKKAFTPTSNGTVNSASVMSMNSGSKPTNSASAISMNSVSKPSKPTNKYVDKVKNIPFNALEGSYKLPVVPLNSDSTKFQYTKFTPTVQQVGVQPKISIVQPPKEEVLEPTPVKPLEKPLINPDAIKSSPGFADVNFSDDTDDDSIKEELTSPGIPSKPSTPVGKISQPSPPLRTPEISRKPTEVTLEVETAEGVTKTVDVDDESDSLESEEAGYASEVEEDVTTPETSVPSADVIGTPMLHPMPGTPSKIHTRIVSPGVDNYIPPTPLPERNYENSTPLFQYDLNVLLKKREEFLSNPSHTVDTQRDLPVMLRKKDDFDPAQVAGDLQLLINTMTVDNVGDKVKKIKDILKRAETNEKQEIEKWKQDNQSRNRKNQRGKRNNNNYPPIPERFLLVKAVSNRFVEALFKVALLNPRFNDCFAEACFLLEEVEIVDALIDRLKMCLDLFLTDFDIEHSHYDKSDPIIQMLSKNCAVGGTKAEQFVADTKRKTMLDGLVNMFGELFKRLIMPPSLFEEVCQSMFELHFRSLGINFDDIDLPGNFAGYKQEGILDKKIAQLMGYTDYMHCTKKTHDVVTDMVNIYKERMQGLRDEQSPILETVDYEPLLLWVQFSVSVGELVDFFDRGVLPNTKSNDRTVSVPNNFSKYVLHRFKNRRFKDRISQYTNDNAWTRVCWVFNGTSKFLIEIKKLMNAKTRFKIMDLDEARSVGWNKENPRKMYKYLSDSERGEIRPPSRPPQRVVSVGVPESQPQQKQGRRKGGKGKGKGGKDRRDRGENRDRKDKQNSPAKRGKRDRRDRDRGSNRNKQEQGISPSPAPEMRVDTNIARDVTPKVGTTPTAVDSTKLERIFAVFDECIDSYDKHDEIKKNILNALLRFDSVTFINSLLTFKYNAAITSFEEQCIPLVFEKMFSALHEKYEADFIGAVREHLPRVLNDMDDRRFARILFAQVERLIGDGSLVIADFVPIIDLMGASGLDFIKDVVTRLFGSYKYANILEITDNNEDFAQFVVFHTLKQWMTKPKLPTEEELNGLVTSKEIPEIIACIAFLRIVVDQKNLSLLELYHSMNNSITTHISEIERKNIRLFENYQTLSKPKEEKPVVVEPKEEVTFSARDLMAMRRKKKSKK
ncbi:hypothetical protein PCE1_001536 [Barthelona sp. PCE]